MIEMKFIPRSLKKNKKNKKKKINCYKIIIYRKQTNETTTTTKTKVDSVREKNKSSQPTPDVQGVLLFPMAESKHSARS